MGLISFDVFDTLLTRAVGQPGDSFLLLGRRVARRGLIPCSPEVFARARSAAEHRAFANAGGLDSRVNLEQIYAELSVVLGLDPSQRDLLMAEELRLETAILRPVPPMANELAAARASGHRVAFVSDMYLPAETIKQFLCDHGIATPDDPCYVSNEYARSKESGRLFETLLSSEQVRAEEVTHIGNNAYSDVRCARVAGLRAKHFGEGNLNRYEEALSGFNFASEGLSSAFAGASRLTRLNFPVASSRERALRDVGAGVAGPLLTAFTLWALREAQHLGLGRLYFVSRDGQSLLEIARRLAPKLGLDLDLRYFYGSRQAWILAGVTTADEDQLGRIYKSYDFMSIDQLTIQGALERVDLAPQDLADQLATVGFSPGDWTRNLDKEERVALRDLLLHNSAVRALIAERGAAARELMLAYMRQEGMFDGTPYALVDLGMGGTLHRALEWVLATVDNQPLISLYLGNTNPTDDIRGEIRPFFFDAPRKTGFREVPGLLTMVEAVASADHGTVLGYQRVGDRIEPLLKEPGNEQVYAWGYGLVREAMVRFAEHLLLDSELVNPWVDMRPFVTAPLQLFWLNPTKAEAEAWSSFPYEDGWGKAHYQICLGRPYRWSDLPRIMRTHQLRHHRHNWQRGSLVLTPPLLRSFLGLFLLAQTLVSKQKRRPLRQLPRRLLYKLKGA